jgi:fibronectin type 3 domain-containing protein
MKMVGANPKPTVKGAEALPGKLNYYLGKDREKWRTGVPTYAKVRYQGVYPGVDAVYYGHQGQLEYDFVVAPGVDPGQIRLAFEGAQQLEVDAAGDLVLHTPGGSVRQHKPIVYQEVDGQRVPVAGEFALLTDGQSAMGEGQSAAVSTPTHPYTPRNRFALRGRHTSTRLPQVGFRLAKYDATRPLIIDPPLSFSTYLGGGDQDFCQGIGVDSTGKILVSGYTLSVDFPTQNPSQATLNGGSDAFVAKIDPDSPALLYATYLGGSRGEQPSVGERIPIAVDPAGNAYVTGPTASNDFPTTQGVFQSQLRGPSDAFVTKLDGVGALVYSTYLGGSKDDPIFSEGIAVNAAGNAFVAGDTISPDFPVTNGAFQTSNPNGDKWYVTELETDGSDLEYSTLFGDPGVPSNSGKFRDIALDGAGNVYLAGDTSTAGMPITANALQRRGTGGDDVYVAKLDPRRLGPAALLYSTLLGGAGNEESNAIAVDSSNNIYVAGVTASTDFPTKNPFQPQLLGSSDTFLTKIAADGQSLSYSTYLGGGQSSSTDTEAAADLAVDNNGSAYLTGVTSNANFPTANPLSGPPAVGLSCFVSQFSPDGQTLVFSTFLDGGAQDFGNAIAVDPVGNIYVGGQTRSVDFPTVNPLQNALAGGTDAFVVKIGNTPLPPPPPPPAPSNLAATAVSATEIDLTWKDNSGTETGFEIERKAGNASGFSFLAAVGSSVTQYQDTNLTPNTTYSYRVRATNDNGPSAYSNIATARTLELAPSPPDNLTALAVSATSIRLTWTDTSNNEQGFRLERSADQGISWTLAGTVGPNITLFVDQNLAPSTTYLYRVQAFNTGGGSAFSNLAVDTTLPPIPVTPANLTAVAVDYASIKLTWEKRGNEATEFRIERQIGNGRFVQVAVVSGDDTSFVDTGLVDNTSYGYRIVGANATGVSPYSNTARATTPVSPPAAPSSLEVKASAPTSFTLTWRDNSDNEDGFKIEFSDDGGQTFIDGGTAPRNATSFTLKGLAPDTTYDVRVRAFRSGNNSDPSNTATLTTPPGAPTGLAVAGSTSTEVDLRWLDNSSTEAGFKIERSADGGRTFRQIDTVGAKVITYQDKDLAPGTAYQYRVRAFSATGDSAYSNVVDASTQPTPPLPPTGLKVSVLSQTALQLNWTDASNNETAFELERSTDSGVRFLLLARLDANTRSYKDENLDPNTTYVYRIRAVNTAGNSPYSEEVTGTTQPTPPDVPSTLGAKVQSGTEIDLSWANGAGILTQLKLERKTGNGAYVLLTPLDPTTTSYKDKGLTPNTAYSYRLRASNGGGDSPYSNEAGGTTFPAAPTNLTATPRGTSEVQLSWRATGGSSGYKIERRSSTDDFIQIGTVTDSRTTSFTDKGLLGSGTFVYRIRAFNNGGNSDYSNEAEATTQLGVASLSFSPNRVRGGRNVTGRVTLSGPATSRLVIQLRSNNSQAASTPRSVTIAAGSSTATFRVRTRRPRRTTTVVVSATLNGTSSTATLTVVK